LPFFERHSFLFRRLHSLSGIVPIGVFLISHLLTNSSVVWGLADSAKIASGHAGVATFQHEVNFIHSIPFLLIIEASLWGAIAFHSILGVFYALGGRNNLHRYAYQGNRRYALQRISGYVGILFIFYHVATLRWGWTFLIPGGTKWSGEFAASTMAAILRGGASGVTTPAILVAVGYFLGISLLVFHFANGLWTAAITWGLTVSASAQKRWGLVCGGLGAGLMAMAWASLVGFLLLDPAKARKAEESLEHGGRGGEAAMAEMVK
jgi:succinate dehydrogenase / fumarate reductase cytochrome b subunit